MNNKVYRIEYTNYGKDYAVVEYTLVETNKDFTVTVARNGFEYDFPAGEFFTTPAGAIYAKEDELLRKKYSIELKLNMIRRLHSREIW